MIGFDYEVEEVERNRYHFTGYIAPIAYRKNGSFQRILNNIAAGESALGPIYVVNEFIKAGFRMSVPAGVNVPVAKIGSEQADFILVARNINESVAVVVENKVVYPNLFDNADLELIVAGHVLEKNIVLRQNHPSRFEFIFGSPRNFDPEKRTASDFSIKDPYLWKEGEEDVPLIWETREFAGGSFGVRVDLPAGDWAGWNLDPTTDFTVNADVGGADTYIYSYAGTTNYGSAVTVITGRNTSVSYLYRSLLKFDISSIPTSSVVNSTSVNIYQTVSSGTTSYSLILRRFLKDWVHNQATWSLWKTGTNWSTSGANGMNTDVSSTTSASLASTTANGYKSFTAAQLTTDVQSFIDGTASNYGWRLNYQETLNSQLRTFASSNNATTTYRPYITVDYTASSSPIRLILNHLRQQGITG